MESIIYVGVDLNNSTNKIYMFDKEHNHYLEEATRMKAKKEKHSPYGITRQATGAEPVDHSLCEQGF
ncbi:MAG: hypothetical protein LKE40_10935 [Spirochaetia bacterium]|nr:hypothetical protein [Spirochaetia bacterium]